MPRRKAGPPRLGPLAVPAILISMVVTPPASVAEPARTTLPADVAKAGERAVNTGIFTAARSVRGDSDPSRGT